MTIRSLAIWAVALAAVCFVPPVVPAGVPDVSCIDSSGRETTCARTFAYVEAPRRDAIAPLAPVEDLSYTVAEAGPEGCLWLLGGVALVALVRGLWTRGFLGAARRVFATVVLGAPLCLGLLYASCFLPGRVIRLGPEASEWVPASLHVHTNVSTGLLSPEDSVRWHHARGFRVLNVTDRDSIRGGVEARAFAESLGLVPSLLVTVGDEWHGNPDIAFVNVTRHHPTGGDLKALATAVHDEGGALFIAHPWSKVPAKLSLEDIFEAGVDGVEVVNGVIHGGEARTRTALDRRKTLFGVIDHKYGPHVNALTLLDARMARTPEGVVQAVREGPTLVLHAVPGGVRSAEEWKAAELGLRGAAGGLASLYEAPRARRCVWFAWVGTILGLWWLATRERKVLAPATSRILLVTCGLLLLALLLGVWFEARAALGVVPVPVLLLAAAVLAVPFLAASHSLATAERGA
jgi:predicted metal-dependent phosphoesterase TrpH